MTALLNDPIVRHFALPFAMSLFLAGLIRWVGAGNRGEQAAGATIGIIFAWTSAYELGVPLFPPSADDNNIFYMLAAALLIGLPCDFFRARNEPRSPYLELPVVLLFVVAAVYSLHHTLDIWLALLVVAMGGIVFRLHIVGEKDAPVASAMLALAGAGLSLSAWIAGLETNLAFQFTAIAIGYFLLNWLDPTMRFGMTLILTGAGALLVVGLRLAVSTHAIIPALLILGFILFADGPVRRLLNDKKGQRRWLLPLLVGIVSILPIALAVLAAHVGVNFEAS